MQIARSIDDSRRINQLRVANGLRQGQRGLVGQARHEAVRQRANDHAPGTSSASASAPGVMVKPANPETMGTGS